MRHRRMILLSVILAGCWLALVSAGNTREKENIGTRDAKSALREVDRIAPAPVIAPQTRIVDEINPASDFSAAPPVPNFLMDWYSVNGGGATSVAGTNFRMGLSVGQGAAGSASGTSYNLGVGFWYGAAGSAPCPVAMTGDVNLVGNITSADIIYLVNFVFKGSASPMPCEAAGDVNCTGSVTSADIIVLVNFVFKGGTPPCDVCTLIPGIWSCP